MTAMTTAAPSRAAFDPVERGLGVLVPVVGAHGGVGASGVALALADALDAEGLRVLLIDGADVARSGLADVWTRQMRSDPPGRSGAVVTTVRRWSIVGRRAQPARPATQPAVYPFLDEWAVPALEAHGSFDATVVDIGWDPWWAFTNVASGPLAWLTARPGTSLAVLVAQATKPSMRLTTGVVARWGQLAAAGTVGAAPHLVVTNTADLDADLRSHAGSVLLPLLDEADLMPPDPTARINGWTAEPRPAPSLLAAQRVLTHLPQPLGDRFRPPAPTHTSRFARRIPKET